MYLKFIFAFSLFFSVLSSEEQTNKPLVLVPLTPYQFIVEQIVKDTAKVLPLVPENADPHTFEPSPRQVMESSRAVLWFQIGESFERKAQASFETANPELVITDLRKGIELIYNDKNVHVCPHCSDESGADIHFWLSPKVVQKQAKIITKSLIKQFPQNKKFYKKNLKLFLNVLSDLDQTILSSLKDSKNRYIAISHPAYSYFCKDYNLEQIAIEEEGKEIGPKYLTFLLKTLKEKEIRTIFVVQNHPDKAALLIADQIGAQVQYINPLSKNYIKEMKRTAKLFADQ